MVSKKAKVSKSYLKMQYDEINLLRRIARNFVAKTLVVKQKSKESLLF